MTRPATTARMRSRLGARPGAHYQGPVSSRKRPTHSASSSNPRARRRAPAPAPKSSSAASVRASRSISSARAPAARAAARPAGAAADESPARPPAARLRTGAGTRAGQLAQPCQPGAQSRARRDRAAASPSTDVVVESVGKEKVAARNRSLSTPSGPFCRCRPSLLRLDSAGGQAGTPSTRIQALAAGNRPGRTVRGAGGTDRAGEGVMRARKSAAATVSPSCASMSCPSSEMRI